MTSMANWKEKAPDNFYACCTAALRVGNEKPEEFARSWLPLSPLWWRVMIFTWTAAITTWSLISFWGPREMFLLYMTHWGLVMILLESLFGIIVCLKSQKELEPDKTDGLPWYVKTYWVLYNITVPLAFLISLFYWSILQTFAGKKMNYAPNPVLDIMLHGVNSGMMLIELVLSSHPSRVLHVMQPLYFSGVYLLFTVAHFLLGGEDPWGNAFIYPVINWAKPLETLAMLTITALFFALMHLITVGIATARDAIVDKYNSRNNVKYNDAFEP
ncbi:protein rolling stone-like [Leptidea sinapis]|uniref:protein rolling stone-like n=1 Tax=Leptidea sinapis TaxID=189913 RepID=UPI002144BAB9|nr:protein rolling stone-like [Leptidea sinapis]